MSFDIDFGEVTALHADLAAAPAKVEAGARQDVQATVSATERDAKAFAPVLTGELKGSIHGHADGLDGEVTASTRYAGYVEEGTSDTAPQPFMGPALDVNADGLERRLGDTGEDIL
ncbi:HK97-gp10 family putative phage morphogenesis protein [Nocardioides jensenii]|uniref:HK97-gp10 family putative phage morphogenesis protein n=1 Tax=Nocardioides jensenii TaxID=1843 RepID=UPI0008311E5B|nr:HK97-gp10 family putative phage morphogenesis protein [Nocardioides jensenii]